MRTLRVALAFALALLAGCHKQEYVRKHVVYCVDNATGKTVTFGEESTGNLRFVYSTYLKRSILFFDSKEHGLEMVDAKDLGQCEIY